MTDRSRPARIAVFAVVAAAVLVAVLVVFGAQRWHRSERYTIDFDGTVYGLERGGDVYFEGVRSGHVASIDVDREHLGRVRVGIVVDRGTPIRADAKAFLLWAGVTGVKEIDIRGGTAAAPPLATGQPIAVGESDLDQLEEEAKVIGARSQHLLDRADRVVTALAELTDRGDLRALADGARRTIDDVAATSRTMRATVEENRARIRATVTELDQAATQASRLIAGPASVTAARADDLVARLDDVVRTTAGQLHSAIGELQRASRRFGDLARDLRESPSRLLFSRPPPRRRSP